MPSKDQAQLKREELARANELLSQLKTEIRVYEKRRDQIRESVEEETKRLKLDREKELESIRREHEAAIPPLLEEQKQLSTEISTLSRQKQGLESDVMGLNGEIEAQRALIGQISKEIEKLKAEKEAIELQSINASTQAANLRSSIAPLKEELAHLTDDVRQLTARRAEVDAGIAEAQRVFYLKKEDWAKELAGLEHRHRELATSVSADAAEIKRAREELVTWQEKLQKFDKTLRAREYKVALAEDKIAQNVGLLNL